MAIEKCVNSVGKKPLLLSLRYMWHYKGSLQITLKQCESEWTWQLKWWQTIRYTCCTSPLTTVMMANGVSITSEKSFFHAKVSPLSLSLWPILLLSFCSSSLTDMTQQALKVALPISGFSVSVSVTGGVALRCWCNIKMEIDFGVLWDQKHLTKLCGHHSVSNWPLHCWALLCPSDCFD